MRSDIFETRLIVVFIRFTHSSKLYLFITALTAVRLFTYEWARSENSWRRCTRAFFHLHLVLIFFKFFGKIVFRFVTFLDYVCLGTFHISWFLTGRQTFYYCGGHDFPEIGNHVEGRKHFLRHRSCSVFCAFLPFFLGIFWFGAVGASRFVIDHLIELLDFRSKFVFDVKYLVRRFLPVSLRCTDCNHYFWVHMFQTANINQRHTKKITSTISKHNCPRNSGPETYGKNRLNRYLMVLLKLPLKLTSL